MEDLRVELKPKKKNFLDKVNGIFEDKKKRYIYMALFMLPFIIAMCVFGFVAYKEAKGLIELATGTNEVKEEYMIPSMNYSLRNNATNAQKEYFQELKAAIDSNSDQASIAGLVCKNFVADFYTWTNKQGQYDVGGMCYVYDMEDTKNNTYIQARDEFYKYLNNYIKDYGVANLLEVENAQVTSVSELPYSYVCAVNTHMYDDTIGHYYADVEYEYGDVYEVIVSWNYKQNSKFDTSKYATTMNFIVINNGTRFEIVESSDKKIDARKVETIETEDDTVAE